MSRADRDVGTATPDAALTKDGPARDGGPRLDKRLYCTCFVVFGAPRRPKSAHGASRGPYRIAGITMKGVRAAAEEVDRYTLSDGLDEPQACRSYFLV